MKSLPTAWMLRLLREGAWFNALPAALQDRFVSSLVVRTYRRGQTVTRAGSRVDGLYGLLEGRLLVIRPVANNIEDLIHVAEPGFWIGEYSLLTDDVAMVSTIASTASRMVILPRPAFDAMIDEEPGWFRPFARLALQRYGLLLRQLADTRTLPPEARLRARLADIIDLRRHERFSRGPIVLRLSQEELARIVGVSRQTLNALLADMRAAGLIELGFRSLKIADPDRFTSATTSLPRRVS